MNPIEQRPIQTAGGGNLPPPLPPRNPTLPPKNPNCCAKVIRSFKEAIQHFVDAIKHTVAFLAHSMTAAVSVQSLCKFGKSTINFAKYAFKAESPGFNNLRHQLETVDGVLDIAELMGDTKYWTTGHWKKDSVWRVIGKGFGTASRVLGVTKLFVDIGLVSLAKVAAHLNRVPFFRVVGEYSPLKLFKDAFTVISASFTIVDTSIVLHRKCTDENIVKDIEIQEIKLKKWKIRDHYFKFMNMSDVEKNNKLIKKYALDSQLCERSEERENAPVAEDRQYARRNAYVQHLNAKMDDLRNKLRDKYTIEPKHNHLLENMENMSVYRCQGNLIKRTQELKNHKVDKTKNWITIAFNVVKIAAVSLGLVALFALALQGPVLALVLGAAWLLTSSMGMAKLYYEFRQNGNKDHQEELAKAAFTKHAAQAA